MIIDEYIYIALGSAQIHKVIYWQPTLLLIYTGWNDNIVAQEKTTWFYFR